MKKLERSLSLPSVVAISIGGMLGSGIFVLPGIAAFKTGPSIWLAYLLAAICVLPAALSKSELATAMPTSGGTYVYIERAFGPILGTISGIGLWMSLLLKASFALVGLGAYLLVIADLPLKTSSISFLLMIMLLNMRGIRKVGSIQLVIISISLTGLVILLLFGMVTVKTDLLLPALTHGNNGLLSATAFVFVSYIGVIKVAAIAEEIKNPERNLPIATLLALFIAATVYVLVAFTIVGNVPVEQLADDIHPIYTVSAHLGGNIAGIIAAVVGVLILISGANSGVLASSRFPFAMSRDKLLPDVLSAIHSRFLTPITTIAITCLVIALVIVFLDVEKIVELASAFTVAIFIMVNASVIILRETAVQWYEPAYRSPLYPWVQIFGILSGLVLLVFLGLWSFVIILIIGLIGAVLFFAYGRTRAQRSGVLKLYGHRPALFLLYRRTPGNRGSRVGKWLPEQIQESSLDGALPIDARVVVPLFGKERSPEMLVEMGAALSEGNLLQVVHLTEVPDQVMLDAFLHDDVIITSLNRRISAMAEDRNVRLEFDAAVTRDLMKTIYTISDKTHCQWLVLGWEGRAMGGLLVGNPIGWLLAHVNSNFALFKDNGVRYIRKILVCLRPGRFDSKFIHAADQIAGFYGAKPTLLRVLPLSANAQEIESLKEDSERLVQSAESLFRIEVISADDALTAISVESSGYDLLITGTPREFGWLDILLGKRRDRFIESAACSVLRLTIHESVPVKKSMP